MNPAELEATLGPGSFRFRMGLRGVDDVRAWLDATRDDAQALASRRAIAIAHPERFAVAATADRARIEAALDAARGRSFAPSNGRAVCDHTECSIEKRLAALSESLGVDFMLVDRESLRLEAIAVAFPSGWAPEDAVGRGTSAIHAVVPRLEASIGASIERFLANLEEGRAYARENVGISVGDALDRHPSGPALRADASTPLDELRLRVERQCFVGLDARTLLFLLAIRQEPLLPLLDSEATARPIDAWLRQMPEDVARYKGLATVRERILERIARTLASG